jgi:AcrR family transcriptional regulator
MPRPTDPRVIRTRQMLRDALISLILEKGYDALTIQDITDRAGLRRATFYLHYKDKEELLLSILQATFDELVAQIEHLGTPLQADNQYAVNLIIFQHAQDHARLYQSVLGGYGAATITRYVREYLTEKFIEDLIVRQPRAAFRMPVDVVAAFAASMKLNMVLWWLDAGMPYPPDEIAAMCTRLTLEGIPAAFETALPQSPSP